MKLYKRKDRLLLLGAMLLGGISAALSAFISILLQRIIDVASAKDMGAFRDLIAFTLIYLAVLGIIGYLEAYCTKLMIRNVTKHLRANIFAGVMNQAPPEYTSRNTAGYLSALINDVKMVEENHLIPLLLCSQLIIMFLTTLGILFYLSPLVTAILFFFLILMFAVPSLLGRRMQKKQDAYSEKLSEFTAKTKDFLNGYEVIRSYSMLPYIIRKYSQSNEETAGKKFAADRLLAANECFSDILSVLSVISIVFAASYLMLTEKITMGTLMALIQLSSTFVAPVVMLMQNVPKITGIKPVLERLEELSYTHSTVPEASLTKSAAHPTGNAPSSGCIAPTCDPPSGPAPFNRDLICKNLTFGYSSDRPVLQNLQFKIEAQGKYALLGDSGCGKTTLIKLLTGYTTNFSGDILYDGKSIKSLSQEQLNHLTAVIHQNVFLFDTDIYENICLGASFSQQQMNQAIQESGLSQFLSGLEKGLRTQVGENGQNLSGGQRQRIALARALIRRTPILIIDEGTSAVDQKTAHEIEKSLLSQKSLTILTITHHPDESLLQHYDHIYHLQNGCIN